MSAGFNSRNRSGMNANVRSGFNAHGVDSSYANLWCFDFSGNLLWAADVDGQPTLASISLAPEETGACYVLGGGKLYRINAADAIAWSKATPGSNGAICSDSTGVWASNNAWVKYSPTGSQLWSAAASLGGFAAQFNGGMTALVSLDGLSVSIYSAAGGLLSTTAIPSGTPGKLFGQGSVVYVPGWYWIYSLAAAGALTQFIPVFEPSGGSLERGIDLKVVSANELYIVSTMPGNAFFNTSIFRFLHPNWQYGTAGWTRVELGAANVVGASPQSPCLVGLTRAAGIRQWEWSGIVCNDTASDGANVYVVTDRALKTAAHQTYP